MLGINTGWVRWAADRATECRQWATQVQAQTGKSWPAQLKEILALRKAGGRCGMSDYYRYKLYDGAYLHGRGFEDFMGWRLEKALSLALNPRTAVLPGYDKLTFTLMAQSAGLPVVPIKACFHPASHISEGLGLHLRNRVEAAMYLRNPAHYPLFGKPSFSQQSVGSIYLAAYLPESDSVRLLDNSLMPLAKFLDRLEHPVDPRYHKPQCGFLFQDALRLAPEIEAVTQWPAICGVRVVCLNGPEGVQPIRALWKIAMPPNHADNFQMGAMGNLIAYVDLATGAVSRVLSGIWPQAAVVTRHPSSGQSFEGLKLPGWDKILEACQRGGAAFPLMRIHHWDFALTDQGPQILELNDLGATEFTQLHGHGLLTQETRAFLKRHADLSEHPWVAALAL